MARNAPMNISPEQFLKMTETLARVDERTAEMKIQMEKYQASFDTRLNEIDKRVGTVETDVSSVKTEIAGWKRYVLGVVAACSLIGVVMWNIGGDYVKEHIFPTHETALIASNP